MFLNTERACIWSLRVSTCQSSLISKHFWHCHWLKKLFSRQRGSPVCRCCCCETIFLIIAELTYSLTYQIIISPIPSIPDFVYTHFAQNSLWTVNVCLHSMFYTRSAKPVTIYACVGVHPKAREIFQTTCALHATLGNVWASPWRLLETVIVVWFLKTNFHAF